MTSRPKPSTVVFAKNILKLAQFYRVRPEKLANH